MGIALDAQLEDSSGFIVALQSIARYFGRSTSPTVLFSGSPIDFKNIQFVDIEQIAARIGLTATRLSATKLRSKQIDLPAIVRIKSGKMLALTEEVESGSYIVSGDSSQNSKIITFSQLIKLDITEIICFSAVYINADDRQSPDGATRVETRHWLAGAMADSWQGFIYVALAAFFINLIALASPIFIMNVYDRILPNEAMSTLWVLAIGIFVAYTFDFLLKILRSRIIDQTGRFADTKISNLLFDKIMSSTMASRIGSTGEYANRVTQYEFVREFFSSNTLTVVIDVMFVFIFLLVIYYVAGWLYVIPLAAFLIVLMFGIIAQFRIGKIVARAANESSQKQSLLVETISTLETIKSLRAEAPLLRKWSELSKNAAKTTEQIKQLSANTVNATQAVQQLVQVAVILAGAYEFIEGNLTTGAIIAVVILSGRTVAPLSQIAMTFSRMKQAMLSLKIIDQIMDQPEDRPNTMGFVNRQVGSGNFSFEDVSFSYPGTEVPVIKNMSFSVKEGEKIGIIGRIGSGKTTIGRLLADLYTPSTGTLLIDGVDIRHFHPAEVRTAVSFVGQNADLFSGTLKENLLLARPDATDEELTEVAAKTGVAEFVFRHPRGFDLLVGERGEALSVGQRQTVAIARLLLTKPKIIFLDEPSGSMDMASEKTLINNLSNSFDPDVTLIIATHRHSLLSLVDRLIVLDAGKIIADGPKGQVLAALTQRARAAKGTAKMHLNPKNLEG